MINHKADGIERGALWVVNFIIFWTNETFAHDVNLQSVALF